MGTIKNNSSLFWDLYAFIYDILLLNPPYRDLLKTAVRELSIDTTNMILLDAGCGTGNLELELQNDLTYGNLQIYTLDSSFAMLNRARQKNRQSVIHFSYCDLNNPLSYQDNFFDRIASINVLYSLNNPESAVREFYRILKPKGKLVIVNPKERANLRYFFHETLNAVRGWRKIALFVCDIPLLVFNTIIAARGRKRIYHFWGKNRWIETLTKVGYNKINITPVYIQGYCIVAYK